MKNINSNDIARLAGVSRSTVSRVINGYANVPDETREKVMKVIRENHYYPHISGRLLTGMNTQTLGLFWCGSYSIAPDPLTSGFFLHIVDAAARRGYLVLSCILDDLQGENAEKIRRIFLEGRIDAGIFVGASNQEPLVDELTSLGKIVGMLDYYHENESAPNCLSVCFERDSGEKAVDYLHSLGHRKIAVLDGDLTHLSCAHRHKSVRRGIEKHGLTLPEKWQACGGLQQDTGCRAAREMLSACMDALPTVICAHNDTVAFGVYQACVELGLRIPEDISVIGMDGHPNARYAAPPLTTFSFDFGEMFASLVNRVIDTVEGKEDVPACEFFSSRFVERASCRNTRLPA